MRSELSSGWDYTGAAVPVAEDVADLHAESWSWLGSPGQWWSGAQRAEMVQEVRSARVCLLCSDRRDALSPMSVAGEHTSSTSLAPEVIEVVHRLTTDASRLTRAWAGERIEALGAAPYAEIVGAVAIVHILDVFRVATSVDQALAPPAVMGEPTRDLPADLDDPDSAYVPQHREPVSANVRRALGIVPTSSKAFRRLTGRMYSGDVFADLVWTHRALDRPQVELLAARTSSLNECFY